MSDDKDKGADGAPTGDGEQAAQGANPPASSEPTAAAETPAASVADAPAWQAEDYVGPLSGEQAAWRNANLKPAVVDETKPAAKARTK